MIKKTRMRERTKVKANAAQTLRASTWAGVCTGPDGWGVARSVYIPTHRWSWGHSETPASPQGQHGATERLERGALGGDRALLPGGAPRLDSARGVHDRHRARRPHRTRAR